MCAEALAVLRRVVTAPAQCDDVIYLWRTRIAGATKMLWCFTKASLADVAVTLKDCGWIKPNDRLGICLNGTLHALGSPRD